MPKNTSSNKKNRLLTSVGIIIASLGLTYAPIPGWQQTITIVTGTELQEPMEKLETLFEQENPNINVELKFQGSQDMVNRYIDDDNDFNPTVIIPANGEILQELRDRWQTQINSEPFYDIEPIAKTMLVGVAWSDRGKVLFQNGRFNWQGIEKAMQIRTWQAIGGNSQWGSFDFLTTNPTRSNSGQLTMALFAQWKSGGGSLNSGNLNQPEILNLFDTVKRSMYNPPRSTDILLQEFITRGPNDADVATVYESIALYRWEQASMNQGKPYQIYYLNPTIETVSTAAIVRRHVNRNMADSARKFINFIREPEQQAVFVEYGFRSVSSDIDLRSVPNSPWAKNIPGAEVTPPVQTLPVPNRQVINEIQRLWQKAN